MTALTRYFDECDRLEGTLRQRAARRGEPMASRNMRAATAVALACFSVFAVAAALL